VAQIVANAASIRMGDKICILPLFCYPEGAANSAATGTFSVA
jgi:hypothetical protein